MTRKQKWLYPLLLGCCTLIFSNQLLDYFHHSRFLALSVLALVFAGRQLFIQWRIQSKITPIGLVLISFTIFNILSVLWAHEKSEALFNAGKWMLAFSIYFLFLDLYRKVNTEQLLHYIAKFSRGFTVFVLVVVWYSLIEIITLRGFSNENLYELKILFGHKSLIAAFIFLLLPLNVLDDYRKLFEWPILLLVFLQTVTIVMLQSRTVYLSIFLFLLIVAFYLVQIRGQWITKAKARYLYVLIVIVAASVLFVTQQDGFKDRLNITSYLKSQTATERQDVWRMSKPLIRDHWAVGVGGGNWKIEFPANGVEGSYRMQDQNVFFTRAHNDFLEVWAELGVGGLLLYLVLFGLVLTRLHRCRNVMPWQSRMLITGVLGFAISSLLDFPKERTEFLAVFATYLAMVDLMFPQKKGLKLQAKYIYGSIFLSMMVLVDLGIMRYRGEQIMTDVLRARVEGNWSRVLKLSVKAENRFYHLDPYSVPIQYYQGLAHYQLDQRDEALVAFTKAHGFCPYNFHVLNNLATVALDRKDYNKADLWLDEALRINPRFEDAIYNKSYSHAIQGRFNQSIETLNSIPSDSDKKELFRKEILKLQNSER
ncbi:MAG: O-antigen ligase family protein [Saprospiraceae bacterium]|nr:O-antigen ligase family protein [Saprospiraceae bacterium]